MGIGSELNSLELMLHVRVRGREDIPKTESSVRALGNAAKTESANIDKMKASLDSTAKSADKTSDAAEELGEKVGELGEKTEQTSSTFKRYAQNVGSAFTTTARGIKTVADHTEEFIKQHPLLVAGITKLTYTAVSHATSMDKVANSWRAVRLAMSPTLGTVGTIGAGIAVEALLKNARQIAAVNREIAVTAAQSGTSFESVAAGRLLNKIEGSQFAAVMSGKSTEQIRDLTEQYAKLVDPMDKATFAVQNFKGNELEAMKVLELGKNSITDSARAAEAYGNSITKLDRESLERLDERLGAIPQKVHEIASAFRAWWETETLGRRWFAMLTAHLNDTIGTAPTVNQIQGIDAPYQMPSAASVIQQKLAQQRAALGLGNKDISQLYSTNPATILNSEAARAAYAASKEGIQGRLSSAETRRNNLASQIDLVKGTSLEETVRGNYLRAAREVGQLRAQLDDIEKQEKKVRDSEAERERLKKAAQQNEEQLRDRLSMTQRKELTGIEKINSEYDDQIVKLQRLKLLTPAARAILDDIREAETANYTVQLSAERGATRRKVGAAIQDSSFSITRAISSGQASIEQLRLADDPDAASRAAFGERTQAADIDFKASVKRIDNMRAESQAREELIHDDIQLERELGEIRVEQIKAAEQYAVAYYNASIQRTKDLLEIEKRRKETDRQIYEIGLGADKTRLQQESGRRTRLAELQAGPGSEARLIDQQYRERLRLTAEIADIELKRVQSITDSNKRRIEAANVEKEIRQQIGEAEIERELKIAELRRQRLDESREQAGRLAGGILGGSKGLRDFFAGEARNLAQGALTNILTPAVDKAREQIGKAIPGQRDAQGNLTPIGKILQGTILGNRETPEVKAAKETTGAVREANVTLQQIRDLIGGGYSPAGGYSPVGGGTGGFGGFSTGTVAGVPGTNSPAKIPGWLKSAGEFTKGVVLGPVGGLGGVIKGFSDPNTSWSQWTGQVAGLGAASVLGAMEAANNFRQGGARGIIGGIGAAAGTAAMLDPEPVSRAILTSVAAVGSIAKALFGDPRENRRQDIESALQNAAYRAPLSQSVTQDMSGNYLDFDARGNARSSPFRALPSIVQPYATWQNVNGQNSLYEFSGVQTSPYQQRTQEVHYHIYANDAQSFSDMVRRNPSAIHDVVASDLHRNDSHLANAIRFVAR